MPIDPRSYRERQKHYPPSPKAMINRCTKVICGAPNELFFDIVNSEILSYLKTPGLTANDLYKEFGDVAGSFSHPKVDERPTGEWLSWGHVGWLNTATATRLANSSPWNWVDILRIPGVGPDTYYDMFRRTLFRMINAAGECLGIFRWPGGQPIDAHYFCIKQTGVAKKSYVKTFTGIPIDVETGKLFIFPALGDYKVKTAYPKEDFFDPNKLYQPTELVEGTRFETTAQVTTSSRLLNIGVLANGVTVYCDKRYTKIAIVQQKSKYWAWAKDTELVNKNLVQCTSNTCQEFAFRKQEDLENRPMRSIRKPALATWVTFLDLPNGQYKILGYSDKDIIIATACDISIDGTSFKDCHLNHTYDFSRKNDPLPRKSFLQGDIIRQSQRHTSNCGTFSFALAASYWLPFIYNPRERNGKWVEENHGSWLPGTFQGTMVEIAAILGFSSNPTVVSDSISRDDAINELKKWIVCGVPVIVNIDEYQDTSLTKGEHYKVLVGYDDDAVLHFTREDGSEGNNLGALYFANSGAKGLDEGDPSKFVDGISVSHRENHNDYNNVPIGNDVDAYNVFWNKWKEGGIPLLTESRWYLPLFPNKK